jgi:hypothetical protein
VRVLGCFHSLAIVNNGAINAGFQGHLRTVEYRESKIKVLAPALHIINKQKFINNPLLCG